MRKLFDLLVTNSRFNGQVSERVVFFHSEISKKVLIDRLKSMKDTK